MSLYCNVQSAGQSNQNETMRIKQNELPTIAYILLTFLWIESFPSFFVRYIVDIQCSYSWPSSRISRFVTRHSYGICLYVNRCCWLLMDLVQSSFCHHFIIYKGNYYKMIAWNARDFLMRKIIEKNILWLQILKVQSDKNMDGG